MTNLNPTWLELQASEEKFSKAFQSSPALMAISAIADGRIIDVNAAFVRSLGFTRDELVGHTSLELGLFVDPAQRAVMTQAVQTTGSLHDLEIEVRTKGGDILNRPVFRRSDPPARSAPVADRDERHHCAQARRLCNKPMPCWNNASSIARAN